MIPILLRLGPVRVFGYPLWLTIYSYGLMMALGFLAAEFILVLECRRRGLQTDFAASLVVWAAIIGLAGSRLLDIVDNFSDYLANPWSMVFSGSGFVWYGGLLGGLLATVFVARRYAVGWLTTADMCAPALALGHAIGRLGCQLSGDGDWGLPSKLPWAMAYPKAIVGWNERTVLKLDNHGNLVSGFYPGVRVHPAPIYETVLYLGVFAVLWLLRKKIRIEGKIFYLYLILAGASRFFVEFFRINPRLAFGLSEAQFISVAMMVGGLGSWLLGGPRRAPAMARNRRVALRT